MRTIDASEGAIAEPSRVDGGGSAGGDGSAVLEAARLRLGDWHLIDTDGYEIR